MRRPKAVELYVQGIKPNLQPFIFIRTIFTYPTAPLDCARFAATVYYSDPIIRLHGSSASVDVVYFSLILAKYIEEAKLVFDEDRY